MCRQRLAADGGLRDHEAAAAEADVVPALLLTVERAVAAGAGIFRARKPLVKAANRKLDTHPAGMRKLLWLATHSVVSSMFADATYKARRPPTLNRYWALHGRAPSAWATRTECIRLFHALHTISALVERKR